ESDFHSVEMASYIRGVDVSDGHVEASARAAHFLGGSDDGFGVSKNLAHGVAAGHVPEGAVLDFTGSADDSSLTVALDGFDISAQGGHKSARHFEAQGLEIVHEAGNVFHVGTGEGIADHDEGCRAPQRHERWWTSFVEDFFDRRQFFSNQHFGHEINSRTFQRFSLHEMSCFYIADVACNVGGRGSCRIGFSKPTTLVIPCTDKAAA